MNISDQAGLISHTIFRHIFRSAFGYFDSTKRRNGGCCSGKRKKDGKEEIKRQRQKEKKEQEIESERKKEKKHKESCAARLRVGLGSRPRASAVFPLGVACGRLAVAVVSFLRFCLAFGVGSSFGGGSFVLVFSCLGASYSARSDK